MEAYVCAGFVLYCVALGAEKGRLTSPLPFFLLLLGLYSYVSIYFAYEYNISGYGVNIGEDAAVYGLMCSTVFFLAYLLTKNKSFSKKTIGISPRQGKTIIAALAILGGAGSLMSMIYIAGSPTAFLQNLYLRQELSIGKTWVLFFVFPLKTSYFLFLSNKLQQKTLKLDEKLLNWGFAAAVLATLSLVGGRIFSVGMLLQIVIIQIFMSSKGVGFLRTAIMGILVFLIVFVYGVFRWQQGVDNGSDLISFSHVDNDVFASLMVDNFFDGWATLCACVDYVLSSGNLTYGMLVLLAPLKMVPGLWDLGSATLIPTLARFHDAADLGARTTGFIAESFLEFGWAGALFFFPLGFVIGQCRKKFSVLKAISNRSIYVVHIYIYSVLFIFVANLIRSGIEAAFTFLFCELFWLGVVALVARKKRRNSTIHQTGVMERGLKI